MLEQNIIEQLHSVFSNLENEVTLVYQEKIEDEFKDKQIELIQMLSDIASTSDKIKLKASFSNLENRVPHFHLEYAQKNTGISFSGIPGGHEFTSLIIAILNADGKGKFPDSGIINRIKNLNGPIRLKTIISLSCENCPEVVQALNLMALIHSDFEHEMVDGEYFPKEMASLKIQSVPSVISNDSQISIGKSSISDLLLKLVGEFGITNNLDKKNNDLGIFDVVVIGGGPAGSSAAIYAARKGFSTAILCDKMGGQVNDTKGIENLISVTYTEGPLLAQKLNEHIEEYNIKIFEHRKVKDFSKFTINEKIKSIQLESGETINGKAIIIATGAKWRELNIAGEKEYIGRGVAYCPHCDGPFYKGKKIAVVGGGNSGVEAAIDLAQIVREVVLFEYLPGLKADKVLVDKLRSLPNVSIITNVKCENILGDGDKVTGLNYLNRSDNLMTQIDLDGIFVQIGLVPNSQFAKEVIEVTNIGEIIIDHKGKTNIKGIYAAGDVTIVPYKQIIVAMGEGAKAALSASEDLMIGL